MEGSKIGKRISSFREKNSLSTSDLAKRTGLTEEFIISVERDDTYPSLGPLLKIARALGVRLGTFMDDQVSKDPLITRLAERTEELTTHKGSDKAVAQKFYSLGKGKSDRHMEPFVVELMPEPDEDKNLSSHEGEEFIIVTKGKLEVTHGREKHVLEPGDSIYFNSIVPHNVSAKDEPCEIHAVLYFPE